jgi:hypothetical protein
MFQSTWKITNKIMILAKLDDMTILGQTRVAVRSAVAPRNSEK